MTITVFPRAWRFTMRRFPVHFSITGETGCGKSTLMDTLFNTSFDANETHHTREEVELYSKAYGRRWVSDSCVPLFVSCMCAPAYTVLAQTSLVHQDLATRACWALAVGAHQSKSHQ